MSETGADKPNNEVAENVAAAATTNATTAAASTSAIANDNESMASLKTSGVDCAEHDSTLEAEQNDEIMTLDDVLDQQKEIDMEYAAVLGGSDFKSCTYEKVCKRERSLFFICLAISLVSLFSIYCCETHSQGYIKRQALYACLTCSPEARTDAKQRAGVCLACSYSCHSGHELIELYTKRAFRCDCGTSRILAVRCRLDENKLEANTANHYNHNFSGVYCTCARPYPDPEDPIEDEMIQCVVCEDWYHCRHLGVPAHRIPSTGDFSEMICGGCMERNEFLQHYVGFCVQAPLLDKDESTEVDVEATPTGDEKSKSAKSDPDSRDGQFTDEINKCIQDIIEINKSDLGEDGTASDVVVAPVDDAEAGAPPPTKKQKLNDASEKVTAIQSAIDVESAATRSDTDANAPKPCRKPRLAVSSAAAAAGATFWPDGWRSRLCDCAVCAVQLQRKRVEFLLDPEDTVRCYEEKGLAKMVRRSSDGEMQPEYDVAMSALSQLDHGSQVDILSGYNKLKEKLTDFLRGFVANEQVVTEEDIKRFFRMMREGGGGANGLNAKKPEP